MLITFDRVQDNLQDPSKNVDQLQRLKDRKVDSLPLNLYLKLRLWFCESL